MCRECVYVSLSDAKYWFEKAENDLINRLKNFNNVGKRKAKNIILFMGDGMSIPTITSARILQGERNNLTLTETQPLSFENFHVSGLSKVSSTNSQPTTTIIIITTHNND